MGPPHLRRRIVSRDDKESDNDLPPSPWTRRHHALYRSPYFAHFFESHKHLPQRSALLYTVQAGRPIWRHCSHYNATMLINDSTIRDHDVPANLLRSQ